MGKTKKTTMKFQNLIFALILLISFSYQSKFQERFLNEEEAHERSEEEDQSYEEDQDEGYTRRGYTNPRYVINFEKLFPGLNLRQIRAVVNIVRMADGNKKMFKDLESQLESKEKEAKWFALRSGSGHIEY